jgi:RHS repeat-associated protein
VVTGNITGSAVQQNPFLFQGGIQDRATGWVKYGLRWYNPVVGRWTQQDTLDAPLDPANANRYAFAGNDPINNTDPTGRASGGYFCSKTYLGIVDGATVVGGAATVSGGVVSLTGVGAVVGAPIAIAGGALTVGANIQRGIRNQVC